MYEAAGRLQGAKSVWLSPIVEFGVYVINNDSLPSPHMIGRAKALKETSTELRGRLRYAVYDNAIRRQLFREKRLKNIMGAALQNRDFQVYLQPKYRTESETIGGAEALVRQAARNRALLARIVAADRALNQKVAGRSSFYAKRS